MKISHLEAEEDVIRLSHEYPVLIVKFSAGWCGPCKILNKKMEEWNDFDQNKVHILSIDVDEFSDLAETYNVTGLPHTVFFFNGEIQKEYVGGANFDKVVKITHGLLGNNHSNNLDNQENQNTIETKNSESIVLDN